MTRYSIFRTLFFVSFLSVEALCQSDTNNPQVTVGSIETESMGADFLSLSLTDSALYATFESGTEKFANAEKNVLITVAQAESAQRMEFVVLFYQTVLMQDERKKSISKAYLQALKQMKEKHGQLDFKSKLIPKKN